MNIPKWHVMQNKIGQWFWHKKAGNGQITATSVKDFSSKREALKAATKDAWPWFRCNPQVGGYVYKDELAYMMLNKVLVIHEPQKQLRIDDFKEGMRVEVTWIDTESELVTKGFLALERGVYWVIHNKSRSRRLLFITHEASFVQGIISVTEIKS